MKSKRTLAVGLIGHDFMGRAHSNAWRQAPRFFDLPAAVQMKTICGRNAAATKRAAAKLGWKHFENDWHRVVADPEIDIVDICTPNDTHCEIAVAAAQAGKAILCEKPLARNVVEAGRMARAVKRARVVNMVCHNYRRIPAIALAKEMIDRGEIGDRIFHFRARYAQDWIVDPSFPLVWRLQSKTAGSGALGDIGSHIIDLARYLVGEFSEVCAATETFVKERPVAGRMDVGRVGALRRPDAAARRPYRGKVTVDDALTMIGRFRNGALASLEATRFAPGRKNSIALEINGSAGSLFFDLEEMNRLKFFSRRDPKDRQGFRDILVTEPSHPYIKSWWPPGHMIGYEHTFIHTIADFVNAVVRQMEGRAPSHPQKSGTRRGESLHPDFQDGLQNQKLLNAVAQSAKTRNWVRLS